MTSVSPDKEKPNKPSYSEVAKSLGVKHRIGKYAISFFPRDPNGKIYKLVQIMPLDGWITDPAEIERIMRERGLEL